MRDHRDFIRDVLDYAEKAKQVADGLTLVEVANDPIRLLALERALEIIGEASSKLPEEVRARYPDVAWSDMIGLRNRLAHGYFRLDPEILFRTAAVVIPALLPRLREIVRLEGADRPPDPPS